jgi:hypothetical protein
MKLEPRFENKNGKLFLLETGSVVNTDNFTRVDPDSAGIEQLASPEFAEKFCGGGFSILGVCIAWKNIEISKEVYNEEFLAALRDFLKNIETAGVYAVIVPEMNGAEFSQYTAAMVHVARRIKDCGAVVGFAFPRELVCDSEAVSSFIESMSVKHAQYVYFSPENTQNGQLISYQMR